MKPSQFLSGLGVKLSPEQVFAVDLTLALRGQEPAAAPAKPPLPTPPIVVVNNTTEPERPKLLQPSDKENRILMLARERKTATQIAAIAGVSTSYVSQVCKTHGYKMYVTRNKITPEICGKVLALKDQGASDLRIASELNISDSSVFAITSGNHPLVGGKGYGRKAQAS